MGTHFNTYPNAYPVTHAYANTDTHGYAHRESYSDAAASSNTATASRLYNIICRGI